LLAASKLFFEDPSRGPTSARSRSRQTTCRISSSRRSHWSKSSTASALNPPLAQHRDVAGAGRRCRLAAPPPEQLARSTSSTMPRIDASTHVRLVDPGWCGWVLLTRSRSGDQHREGGCDLASGPERSGPWLQQRLIPDRQDARAYGEKPPGLAAEGSWRWRKLPLGRIGLQSSAGGTLTPFFFPRGPCPSAPGDMAGREVAVSLPAHETLALPSP